jgi:hypothetical protein
MHSRRRSGQATLPALLLGLCLAAGLAAAGWLLSDALYRARAADRFVTVKGLAEREVPANLALWPIVFTVTADDLTALQARIDASAGVVREFLTDFAGDEIAVSMPRITDRQGQSFGPGAGPVERYLAETTVTLRTGRIDGVKAAMQRSGELVRRGVAVIRSYESNTQFLFTTIEDRDPFSPEWKRVRVVTTVQFFLEE